VKIKKKYMPASQISFSRIFEELPKWVEQYNGKYETNNKFDEVLQKEIIIIHVEVAAFEKEFNIRIDPQTKLPISIEGIKAKPGQGVKSVDNIEYNVSIPEGLFEFEIPEGAKVVYE
jgi:outer membrane lipoprotein-sorting protein